MGKSHGQSNAVLLRFVGTTAPAISTTYVGLLTTMPTANDPVGWVEWREAENTPIDRIRIYQDSDDGTPSWSDPAIEGNTYETHNVGGTQWGGTDLAILLDGSQLVVGAGVFTTASTTYTDGVPDTLNHLIYWNTFANSLTVTQGESVTFLTGKIKVTES